MQEVMGGPALRPDTGGKSRPSLSHNFAKGAVGWVPTKISSARSRLTCKQHAAQLSRGPTYMFSWYIHARASTASFTAVATAIYKMASLAALRISKQKI